jgi:hypothetical protein
MKKLILIFIVTVVAISCNEKSENAASTDAAVTAVPLPMQPTYSSSFEMGNPTYAAMIVQGSWKDWQDNTMDSMQKWVADTAVIIQSDNKMIRGVDSLMANWKRGRAKYSAVTDSINAVVPLYSTDKKENWVLVWATEYNTKADGTKDTAAVMETWRINKDGKADLLLQYDRHTRKE